MFPSRESAVPSWEVKGIDLGELRPAGRNRRRGPVQRLGPSVPVVGEYADLGVADGIARMGCPEPDDIARDAEVFMSATDAPQDPDMLDMAGLRIDDEEV